MFNPKCENLNLNTSWFSLIIITTWSKYAALHSTWEIWPLYMYNLVRKFLVLLPQPWVTQQGIFQSELQRDESAAFPFLLYALFPCFYVAVMNEMEMSCTFAGDRIHLWPCPCTWISCIFLPKKKKVQPEPHVDAYCTNSYPLTRRAARRQKSRGRIWSPMPSLLIVCPSFFLHGTDKSRHIL